jgi:hypothetical protein
LKSKPKPKPKPEPVIEIEKENIAEAKAAAATEEKANVTSTRTFPKAVVQKARHDGNTLLLVIDADMVKHLGVSENDSLVEIAQVAVPGGVFLVRHHPYTQLHDSGIG